MFWNTFYNLCHMKRMSPNRVAKELGFSSGSVTSWKQGRIPHYDTLLKLSDYFGVSIDYLLGRRTESLVPSDVKGTFQKRLLEAMKMRNMKAADLSRLSGLSKAQISQYTNGRHEARQIALHKLAVALCVSESWLMGCEVSVEREEKPTYSTMTEEEKAMHRLFHSVPKENQKELLDLIETALKMSGMMKKEK